MPRIDPPYPSFTLALSAPPPKLRPPSSRLPAYRASHMARYHPYPRVAPGRCEDRLMTTVDYRYEEEPLWEEPVLESSNEGEDADGPGGQSTAPPLHDTSPAVDAGSATTTPAMMKPGGNRRLKLPATLSEILETLRYRYLSLQAMKSFLKTQQLKGA